jgi:hypothetical protein
VRTPNTYLTLLKAAALTVLVSVGPFAALAAPSNKYEPLSRLPDWSGIWVIPETIYLDEFFAETDPANPRAPKLTPANLAKLLAYNNRRRTGQDPPGSEKARTNTELCLPVGMPAIMRDPVGIEFLFTPGRVTLISESTPNVRRIFTDAESHPPFDPDASTYAGTSVGHWEGQTLVVETTQISPRTQLMTTVSTSGAARVTERIHLKDPKHLQIDTVVEDPGALTAPWRYSMIYDRRDDIHMLEDICLGNNRDLNGDEPDLTPPK